MSTNDIILGKWELYESTGFDDYLKAVGVNFLIRKMITSMSGSSTVEIVKDGEGYILRTISSMKTTETKFKLDVDFDDKLMDGRECKTVFTLKNNVLTQRQFTKDGFETTIDREITPESLTATIRFKDAVCIRKFKKTAA